MMLPRSWHTRQPIAAACVAVLLACFSGCAAVTNPVANGVPARLLPPELTAESKENLVQVPLRSLQRKPASTYKLGPGDILAVFVESVLGQEGQVPPINLPDVASKLQPSVGFPMPVLEDGKLPLPLIDPLPVAGLTVPEAREAVLKAYREREIILPQEQVVLVTLIRPRQVRVLVIREDSQTSQSNSNQTITRPIQGIYGNPISSDSRRGSGEVVELPADQNDLLTALARTGGLPGTDALNEVIVQRAMDKPDESLEEILAKQEEGQRRKANEEIRIPLRLREGEQVPFNQDDVTLHEGDIVYVNARSPESFFTGGLLPAIRVPLPRDEDIDVLEAISMIGGPLLNGGVNGNNLSGGIVGAGLGNPSPKLLTVIRRTPNGQQVPIRVDLERAFVDARERILVQEGDMLLLQETPSQATARYFSQIFQFNAIGEIFNRGDASGSASVVAP